jgi:hypothetical protein
MPTESLHAWITPRLEALVGQALQAGFGREATVATIIDVIGSARFDGAVTPEPEP